MIGLAVSTSQNATMIQFRGGPLDGKSGLYDHCAFDSIQFSDETKRVTHVYVPEDKWWSPIYRYDRMLTWE